MEYPGTGTIAIPIILLLTHFAGEGQIKLVYSPCRKDKASEAEALKIETAPQNGGGRNYNFSYQQCKYGEEHWALANEDLAK